MDGTSRQTGSVFKPAFMLMSGRAVGFVVSFAIPVVLARLFDRSEFGTYKQLFLIFTTLYGIGQLGMAESLYYFLPTAPAARGSYLVNSLLCLGAAGALCLALTELESAFGTDDLSFLSGRNITPYMATATQNARNEPPMITIMLGRLRFAFRIEVPNAAGLPHLEQNFSSIVISCEQNWQRIT